MSEYVSKFDPDTWDEMLDRLAEGKRSLAAICRDADMPGLRTVYDRIEGDTDFAARFRARRAIGVRAIVDDCLEIADEKAEDAVDVADKRVRIDTRLRLAGKWLPKEFGEKLDVNHRGAVAQPTAKLSDDPNEAARQYRDLMSGIDSEDE